MFIDHHTLHLRLDLYPFALHHTLGLFQTVGDLRELRVAVSMLVFIDRLPSNLHSKLTAIARPEVH